MRSRTGSRSNKSRYLYESEGDCTGERVAGQFSIFGAIEEKSGHGFSRINTDKTTTQGRVVLPLDGGRFCVEGVSPGKSGRVGSRNVHRTCTGNAERQGFKVSRFQGFKVSRFQGFKVSRFQGFKASRFQKEGRCAE